MSNMFTKETYFEGGFMQKFTRHTTGFMVACTCLRFVNYDATDMRVIRQLNIANHRISGPKRRSYSLVSSIIINNASSGFRLLGGRGLHRYDRTDRHSYRGVQKQYRHTGEIPTGTSRARNSSKVASAHLVVTIHGAEYRVCQHHQRHNYTSPSSAPAEVPGVYLQTVCVFGQGPKEGTWSRIWESSGSRLERI